MTNEIFDANTTKETCVKPIDQSGIMTHPVGRTFGVHPIATIFPMMSEIELRELGQSMKENGQEEPVVLEMGTDHIIDGRNRDAAARLIEIPLETTYYKGGNVTEFVLAKNLHRRMMTTQQKAIAATRFANMKRGDNQYFSQSGSANLQNHNGECISQKDAAKKFGVSVRTVQNVKKVLDSNNEEMIRAIEAGEMSVSAAAKKLRYENENEKSKFSKPQPQTWNYVTDPPQPDITVTDELFLSHDLTSPDESRSLDRHIKGIYDYLVANKNGSLPMQCYDLVQKCFELMDDGQRTKFVTFVTNSS